MSEKDIRATVSQLIEDQLAEVVIKMSNTNRFGSDVVAKALMDLAKEIQEGRIVNFDIAWNGERLSGNTVYRFEPTHSIMLHLILDDVDDTPTRPQ